MTLCCILFVVQLLEFCLRGGEMAGRGFTTIAACSVVAVLAVAVGGIVLDRGWRNDEAQYQILIDEVESYCGPRKLELDGLLRESGYLSGDVSIAKADKALGKSDNVSEAERALRDIDKKIAAIRSDVRDFLDSRKDRLTESDYQANLLKE